MRIMLTIKKDLPEMPRQALARYPSVPRGSQPCSFPEVKAAGFDRSGKSLAWARQFWAAKRPQKPASIHPLRALMTACQQLVRIGRPGNREQRQNRDNCQRFHTPNGCARLWRKTVRAWRVLLTNRRNIVAAGTRRSHSPRCRPPPVGTRPYSAIASPEPPNSAGKSFSFGRPSGIGSTVSA